MKANDAQCLTLVSFSASNYSAVILTLLDRTLVHLPSQHCWYSFAAEYTESNWGLMKLPKLQERTMPSVGIEPTTLESRVQHPNH